jgi:hypothetical protein
MEERFGEEVSKSEMNERASFEMPFNVF